MEKQNIFNKIRTSCAFVAKHAKQVHIDLSSIEGYSTSLDLSYANNPVMDVENHYVGSINDTIAFFLILDSINFGSGYFSEFKKKKGKTGYFTVASCLKDHFVSNGCPTAEALADYDVQKCASIFAQDLSVHAINELMCHFSSSLKELGAFICKNYDGKFTMLLKEAKNSAAKLVNTLTSMRSFDDCSKYAGEKIYFFKRAQITVSDINIALNSKGLGKFNDIDELTIFADNLVPHVLKQDAILHYSNALETKIRKGILIEKGSDEEIEVRACALHAVELIKDTLLSQERPTTSQYLDYLLWNRGQQSEYRKDPRHSTRTIFY